MTKEKYIKGHDRLWAQLHCNMCKKIGVKLYNEHWYAHVSKSVETILEGNVTILWANKCEPTELFLTINRAT